MPFAAWAPVVIAAASFVAYCLWDLSKAPAVRHLPKWAWAVVCVVSVPLGGVVYLLAGREQR